MKYMIVHTSENDEFISTQKFEDLESAQWELELRGYAKDSDTYYFKGIGRDIKTAIIYKVINDMFLRVEVDGVKYTITELAEKHGLTTQNIYERYRRGARDKDLIKPVRPTSKTGRRIVFEGKNYKNVKECVEHTGLTENQVRYRIGAGKGYFIEWGENDEL